VLGKEKVVKMKQVEHTNSEREMLVRVRHPFLVNLWGTFHDVNNLYMVMDFVAGGELFSLLRKSQVGARRCRMLAPTGGLTKLS
jgi:protein kinase A